MKLYIASDHAGYELKQKLTPYLRELGHEVEDEGPESFDPEDDYPDFVQACARQVASTGTLGIVIGGSGQGEAMAANRISGVRAAVFYGGSLDFVKLAREHNDANILSLGARFVPEAMAKEAVKLFLETPFSGDTRHIRRIAKF